MDKSISSYPIMRLSPTFGIILMIFGSIVLSLELWPQKTLIPYATILMLAIQVGAFLLIMPLIRVRLTPMSLTMLLLWLLLWGWSFLTGFWSEYPVLSLRRALMVFIPTFLLLLLVYSDRRPLETFGKVMGGLVYSGTFLAFIGILLFFAGRTVYLDKWEALQVINLGPLKVAQLVHLMEPWNRISSLTGNPNDLAFILVFSIAGSFVLYYSQRISFSRLLICCFIQGFALLLTLSRTGMGTLVITVGVFTFLLTRGSSKKFVLTLLLVLFLVSVSIFFLNSYLHSPEEDIFIRSETLFTMREYAWARLGVAFTENPVGGSGYGVSFESILEPEGLIRKSHNVYLNTLSELGIPGFLFLMGTWFAPLSIALYRSQRFSAAKKRFPAITMAIVAAFLIGLLAHGFLENVILRFSVYNLLWVYLIGLASHPLFSDLKRWDPNFER